jgi:hypothetical protein
MLNARDKLIRDLRSLDRQVVLSAIQELGDRGWLSEGD